MDILSIIRSKKAGGRISAAQMEWLVAAVMEGSLPDYQLATLLTVIVYEGLDEDETLAMTHAFIASGETLEWSGILRPVVDKHSTGGVGDKVSLALAPLLACAGLALPKMSGRGLGHTGGTIDKLESIPGFSTDLSMQQFRGILMDVGCAIAGQTARLVPADKLFYALRDATDNVRELGLVAASVMSKKLAAGAPCIVLDVKCGSGAFFRDEQEARQFARLAMTLGKGAERSVACVLSDMDQPLGCSVGNRIEVLEVLDLLSGAGGLEDLRSVLLAVASTALVLSGSSPDLETAGSSLVELLDSGAVKQKFREWVRAQGGRLSELPAGLESLEGVKTISIEAGSSGYISSMDCMAIGNVARRCGAGRSSMEDRIVADAGLLCNVSIGERMDAGDEIGRLFIAEDRLELAKELVHVYRKAITIGDRPVRRREPVIDILMP